MTAPGSTAPLAVTRTDAPLAPGATIGVFGGGQLGRMLGIAARRLGYRFAVYSDDHDGPAMPPDSKGCEGIPLPRSVKQLQTTQVCP